MHNGMACRDNLINLAMMYQRLMTSIVPFVIFNHLFFPGEQHPQAPPCSPLHMLHLYADADFAGDRPGFKSTSGGYLAMSGPTTCFPLGAKCQKQTSVSHSTPEAEIVAANVAVRTIGLPGLDL